VPTETVTLDPPVQYRPIVGPGYRIGDDGSIWSCRDARGRITVRWHRLRPQRHTGGYLVINLRAEPGGKVRTYYLHRLVLEAFVGPCPPGMVACHDPDFDRTNNRLSNLRWGTQAENLADMKRLRRSCFGSRHHNAKLSEWTAIDVFRLRYEGLTQDEIGERLGVEQTTVGEILRGEKWQHVHEALTGLGLLKTPPPSTVPGRPGIQACASLDLDTRHRGT
jgi:hypothetical protein